MEPPSDERPPLIESIRKLERVSGVLLSKAQGILEIGRAGRVKPTIKGEEL